MYGVCVLEYNDVFFFQAEDGIRDVAVTGVQTCALPIYIEGVAIRRISFQAASFNVVQKDLRLLWLMEDRPNGQLSSPSSSMSSAKSRASMPDRKSVV